MSATTTATMTPCPAWCRLRPGHDWDSAHDEGRLSRGHRGLSSAGSLRPAPTGTRTARARRSTACSSTQTPRTSPTRPSCAGSQRLPSQRPNGSRSTPDARHNGTAPGIGTAGAVHIGGLLVGSRLEKWYHKVYPRWRDDAKGNCTDKWVTASPPGVVLSCSAARPSKPPTCLGGRAAPLVESHIRGAQVARTSPTAPKSQRAGHPPTTTVQGAIVTGP